MAYGNLTVLSMYHRTLTFNVYKQNKRSKVPLKRVSGHIGPFILRVDIKHQCPVHVHLNCFYVKSLDPVLIATWNNPTVYLKTA